MKFSKWTSTNQYKSNLTKWSLYLVLAFVGYGIVDLTIIYIRDYFLPKEAPPKKMSAQQTSRYIDRSQYSVITQRNLFSSNGEIPEPLKSKEQTEKKEDTPVASSLPINLIGTLVHTDPSKSVAAVEMKSKNISGSYMVGAELEGLAKLEKVERGIIYIRNINNGQLEFIEMNKAANKVTFDNKTPLINSKPVAKEVQSIGNNTFKIKRSDLNKYLTDMSSLLMQARAIPNRDKNTGEINGYRLVDFQPDSIFAQLGLPRGAVIKNAGGEPVNSVQSAMDLFNKLKKEPLVKLGVEVNGSDQTMTYNIE